MVDMILLNDLLSQDPASPRLTVYNEATGARLDFSGVTLENWAAKVANMLRDEFDMEEESTISLDLPSSWQAVAIALGALAAGIDVSFNPAEGAVFFTSFTKDCGDDDFRAYADSVGASGDIVLVTDDPMGRGVEEIGHVVPVGAVDFAPTVRFYGDHFPEDGQPISSFATSSVEPRSRVLGTGWHTWDEFVAQVINPLAAGGSVVIVTDASVERLNNIAEIEKVTTRA